MMAPGEAKLFTSRFHLLERIKILHFRTKKVEKAFSGIILFVKFTIRFFNFQKWLINEILWKVIKKHKKQSNMIVSSTKSSVLQTQRSKTDEGFWLYKLTCCLLFIIQNKSTNKQPLSNKQLKWEPPPLLSLFLQSSLPSPLLPNSEKMATEH